MTDATNQPRALAPRRLESRESIHSLNQFKSVFRNYYRRCPYYGRFLLPGTKWDRSENRGFRAPETSGLKRDIETLIADLDGFLECLASYLPFDYVGEKLKQESVDIASAWAIIYEVYDAELTTTNFLDYATMSQDPDETYRAYFNRLVGFVRQHLPSKRIEAEGVSCPAEGESLTIALLDAITIHWMLSIDRRLLAIVKTEFASDLKNKRICQMIKPIAQNIDELLLRYDNHDQVAAVTTSRRSAPKSDTKQDLEIDAIICRLEKFESQSSQKSKRRFPVRKFKERDVCSHCNILNKQLGASLPTDHSSSTCGRKTAAVSLIESIPVDTDYTSSSASTEGDIKVH